MKTITFIEKRKRFLQAMTLDYTLVPTIAMLMDLDFDITSVERHIARDAIGSMLGEFTVGASVEAHDVEDVAEQTAAMELTSAITAETNGVGETPEMQFADMELAFEVSASEVPAKEAVASSGMQSAGDISLSARETVESTSAAETETSSTIEGAANAAKDVTAEQTSEFAIEISVSVEELTIREVPETNTELAPTTEVEAENNSVNETEPQSAMLVSNYITPLARARKKATGMVSDTFSNSISAVVCRYATFGDLKNKTVEEFFAPGKTLERSLIVPV